MLLVVLHRQDVIAAPARRSCAAIAFWQPIASIVTSAPSRSSNSSSWGMAVISLDFSDGRDLPQGQGVLGGPGADQVQAA